MARYGLDLVVVDYLGKLAYPTTARGFNEAGIISQIVETIKNISERLMVPVMLGSQVSREFKSTADKRPTVNDLKGSGSIEDKANKVIVLHRPHERVEGADSEIIEARVEKNEDGMLGMVELRHMLGRFHIISQVEERDEQPAWVDF
jgi:replicative DNA helicase